MTSIEDVKGNIEELMGKALNPVALGKIYAELFYEINVQFDLCMDKMVDSIIEDSKVS